MFMFYIFLYVFVRETQRKEQSVKLLKDCEKFFGVWRGAEAYILF